MTDRVEQLRGNLAEVRTRIARACATAGRDADEVTLVVVTKTWPTSDIRILSDLGVTDVGENREQEAKAKVAEFAASPVAAAGGHPGRLRWHFVGQVQRKKAGSVARFADVVHSVDRLPLVAALDAGADRADRSIDALVQVGLDQPADAGRGGAAPADVLEICAAVDAAPRLRLAGLMAVAPLGEDPAAAFARLAQVRERVRESFPAADWLSAGMSGDFEAAIAAGATHVRVGSAVLGVRENVR